MYCSACWQSRARARRCRRKLSSSWSPLRVGGGGPRRGLPSNAAASPDLHRWPSLGCVSDAVLCICPAHEMLSSSTNAGPHSLSRAPRADGVVQVMGLVCTMFDMFICGRPRAGKLYAALHGVNGAARINQSLRSHMRRRYTSSSGVGTGTPPWGGTSNCVVRSHSRCSSTSHPS